jgi:hypothetical protein
MGSLSDTSDSMANRSGAILAVVQTVRDMVGRLLGFFALTEDERLKVGIYPGGMEQDR